MVLPLTHGLYGLYTHTLMTHGLTLEVSNNTKQLQTQTLDKS